MEFYTNVCKLGNTIHHRESEKDRSTLNSLRV